MRKSIVAVFTLGALAVFFLTALADQPGEKEEGPKKGPPGKKGWEPGKIIPPPIMDILDLTEDQAKKIDDLEKEVRAKLMKILTEDQLKRVREFKGFKGPKGPPDGKDFDGPPDKKGKGKGKKDGPPKDDGQARAGSAIQWYATLESGRREAVRTGRPILLVSAAPHCAGVSGTW